MGERDKSHLSKLDYSTLVRTAAYCSVHYVYAASHQEMQKFHATFVSVRFF